MRSCSKTPSTTQYGQKTAPKGPEGDEHTDGHLIIDHRAGAQPQYDDRSQAATKVLIPPNSMSILVTRISVLMVSISVVEPVGDTAFRHALHLDRGDTVQRLHEIRAGASISHQRLFGQLAVIAVGQQAHQHVDSSKGKHHRVSQPPYSTIITSTPITMMPSMMAPTILVVKVLRSVSSEPKRD